MCDFAVMVENSRAQVGRVIRGAFTEQFSYQDLESNRLCNRAVRAASLLNPVPPSSSPKFHKIPSHERH